MEDKVMEKEVKTIIDNIEKNIGNIEKENMVDLSNLEEEVDDDTQHDIIKCGSKTDPSSLAFYIAKEFENPDKSGCIIIQTIGPAALSKAIFAIIRLKSIIAPYIDGSTLVTRFSVRHLQFPNGETKTAVRIRLFPIPDRYVV